MRFLTAVSIPLLLAQTASHAAEDRPAAAAASPAAKPGQHAQADTTYLLDRAEEALSGARLIEARILLDRLAQQGGETARAALALEARYALASGDSQKAATLLDATSTDDRRDCRWRITEGFILSAGGKIDETIVALGAAAKDCSLDEGAWEILARALAMRGEERASSYAFQRALALSRKPELVHAAFGRALMSLARYNEARRELDLALALVPAQLKVRDDRDRLAGLMGEAIERAASDTDARWAERLSNLAQGAREGGHMDAARAAVAQALISDPKFDPQLYAQAETR